MPGPRLPITHSESLARQTKARFQYRPALLTPLATLDAAILLSKSALSLHPGLYCWIGFSIRTGAAIYEGVRLQLTRENLRSVIPQVSVANEDCVTTVTPFSFFLVEKIRAPFSFFLVEKIRDI
jgi:hypothetical protein